MAENLDIKVTLDAFSKIVVEKWRLRMLNVNVGSDPRSTKALFNSFRYQVRGGQIDFTYLKYGHYVDRGVGREIYIGNPGDLGFTPKRKPKKWYYGIFMSQARALERIMADKFAIATQVYITETWEVPWLPVAQRSYDAQGNSTRANWVFEARKQELEAFKKFVM